MYKDKDRQREANRQAKARQRAKCSIDDIPPSKREQDLITKGMTKQGVTVSGSGTRVIPNLETPQVTEFAKTKLKRGKDIKCFADLPPDVQQTIDRMSDSTEEKQKRTAIAIKYQHINEGVSLSSSPSTIGGIWTSSQTGVA